MYTLVRFLLFVRNPLTPDFLQHTPTKRKLEGYWPQRHCYWRTSINNAEPHSFVKIWLDLYLKNNCAGKGVIERNCFPKKSIFERWRNPFYYLRLQARKMLTVEVAHLCHYSFVSSCSSTPTLLHRLLCPVLHSLIEPQQALGITQYSYPAATPPYYQPLSRPLITQVISILLPCPSVDAVLYSSITRICIYFSLTKDSLVHWIAPGPCCWLRKRMESAFVGRKNTLYCFLVLRSCSYIYIFEHCT